MRGSLQAAQEFEQVQVFDLDPGWNLIAFQVLPSNRTPASVFASLRDEFLAAWTFDNERGKWTHYKRLGTEGSSVDNLIAPIEEIQIGSAYWIYVIGQQSWEIVGTAPSLVPPVNLTQGWNLIGVPTGIGELPEQINILSVFAASGLDFDRIMRWETDRYLRFTPTDDGDDDFTNFDPDMGHWVRVNSSEYTLKPELFSSVRADVDVEPQGNFPSFEDFEFSQNRQTQAVPLGPKDQTHIVFLAGEDTQQLGIANTGGGILLWKLIWEPIDAPEVNWLQFSDLDGQGVTTIETDVIELFLNRQNLLGGRSYSGKLTLVTTDGDREFTVIANVPGLQGEWRGKAVIDGVSQLGDYRMRKNPLPDIDLHLSFFEDPQVPGLLRGNIDSQNALLWPVDVPLIGHVVSENGNAFLLNGAYILPPGDQNNPPYDKYNPDQEDVDWNEDGLLDNINPYPFPIYRSVTFEGQVLSANPVDGYQIEGDYSELIYGMLRRPIQLEGTFSIVRSRSKPFSERRPIENEESEAGIDPVVLKSSTPENGLIFPGTEFRDTITFKTDFVLQNVSVGVDISQSDPSTVIVELIPPDESIVITLHNKANIRTLAGLSFPTTRTPVDSLVNELIRAGALTRGDWKLIIKNEGTQDVKLDKWTLRLQGQPVFDVWGKVIDGLSGQGLPADVLLDGLSISTIVQAKDDGVFPLQRLPGIPLNLTSSLLGFKALTPEVPGLQPRFTTPKFPNTLSSVNKEALAQKFRPLPAFPIPPRSTEGFGESLGTMDEPVLILEMKPDPDLGPNPRILASPATGVAPLEVSFSLIDPASQLPAGAEIIWDFGDGSDLVATQAASIRHTFGVVGEEGYSVRAIVGSEILTETVLVMPSPNRSPFQFNFFQVHYSSGGSIPKDLQVEPNEPYLMTQHATAASFDIDRAPFTTESNRGFNQDGFAPLNSGDNSAFFKGEDSNYHILEDPCAASSDPEVFDIYPRLGAQGCQGIRFQMLCNVGPQIIPVPNPLLGEGKSGISRSRENKLISGPLASYWKK